jgi:hypothetical protein
VLSTRLSSIFGFIRCVIGFQECIKGPHGRAARSAYHIQIIERAASFIMRANCLIL